MRDSAVDVQEGRAWRGKADITGKGWMDYEKLRLLARSFSQQPRKQARNSLPPIRSLDKLN